MLLKIRSRMWQQTILNVPSGWCGLEDYMDSIIDCFGIHPKTALEFGVDYGYSLHVFSQIFDNVTGVDWFKGDYYTGYNPDDKFYEYVIDIFSEHKNVNIIKQDFRDYIRNNDSRYDLIHVDIAHFYDETYECAEWSIGHSDVVILHDTVSYPEVHQVCLDLSHKYNIGYHNIEECNGLGILYNPKNI